jgi:hypothetical protein
MTIRHHEREQQSPKPGQEPIFPLFPHSAFSILRSAFCFSACQRFSFSAFNYDL